MSALVVVVVNLKEGLFDYGATLGSSVVLKESGKAVGGVDLTSLVFESALPNFSIVLTIAVILFAISTLLSWSYYGLQGWKYIFGKGKISDLVYKIVFLVMILVGSCSDLNTVVAFADAMIFAMVLPNMIGMFILAPSVKQEIKKYINVIGKKH